MPEVTAPPKPATSASQWTRQNPFPGKLVVNQRLSSDDSMKDTRHFEIDLTCWGLKFEPDEFVALLTKLQPRLYSVASSLRVFPNRVHLIVDVVQYESRGRVRKGVASTFLAERADKVPVPVYPSSAKHFHMPDDQNLPLIMIGPGTGIAPFRAFLQERQALGAKGKNWLFFGSQREKCDYAYKEDWEHFIRDGFLTRLDCAWSRDQAHKIYVQHKMLENAAEIWKWIDGEGAQFF